MTSNSSSSKRSDRDTPAGEQPHAERARSEWIVLYDGGCGLCKWLLAILLRWDRAGRLRPLALERPAATELLADLPESERYSSWHLISPAGERRSAGAAVATLLPLLPGGALPAAALARLPRSTERGYEWVATHRAQLSRWVASSAKRRAAETVREREAVREREPVRWHETVH